jgi:uncharacterized protein (TIRG00374 family)
MKKQVLIGLLISAVFLYLAFRNVDLPEMLDALEKANYWWLVPGIAMMFISLYIRAYRWQYFLLSIAKIPIKKLFSAMMIGYMANNVMPLRLGEIMLALAIGNATKISRTSAFATILVERIIDVISLLIILGFTVFFYDFPPNIKNAGVIIFVGSVVLIVFIVLLMEKTEKTLRFIWWLCLPLPRRIRKSINKNMRKFLDGFAVFRQTHHFPTIIIQSILLWLLYAGIIYVTFFAFKLKIDDNSLVIASLVILVMVSIGIMIPSSPGFIGTYHYLCQQGLALFGVAETDALSFAIVLHISNYIPVTLVGFYYFWKQNLHFRDAIAEKKLVKQKFNKDGKLNKSEAIAAVEKKDEPDAKIIE